MMPIAPEQRRAHLKHDSGFPEHRDCQSGQRQPRLLWVDDDDDLTRFMKARLRKLPLTITRASCGREGLKKARGHRPNVIITDLGMDKGGGEYLIQKIRKRPSTSGIPIIVISGMSPERLAYAHMLGADVVLQKPLSFDDLTDAVFACLSNGRDIDESVFPDATFSASDVESASNVTTNRFDVGGHAVGPHFSSTTPIESGEMDFDA